MNTSPTPIITDSPKAAKPSLGRRMLKKGLVFLLAAFALIFVSSVIIAAFFEKQIGDRLLTEINKQLKTELSVGSFNLSLLSGFPKVAAQLNEVTLEDAMEGVLLEANNVSFNIGLFSLLSSDIKIHSVLIQDGALYVHIDRRGKMNYDILKEVEALSENEEDSSNDFAISIEEALLEDIELIYLDDRAKQQVKLQIEDADLSGNFSSEAFSMTSVAKMKSDFIEMKDGRYLVGKNLTYESKMKVDLTNRKYEFEEMNLLVESNLFSVSGLIDSKGSATDFDLQLTAEEGSIESVIDFLPEKYLEYFNDFKSKGKFDFNASILGILNEKRYPAIKVSFGLEHGEISSPRLQNALEDVSFKGSFSNGKYFSNKTSTFSIKNFKSHLNRQLIESDFTLYNLDDPAIDLQLSGVLDLEDIFGFLKVPNISEVNGLVEVNDLLIKGRLKDMASQRRISKVKTGGNLTFDDARLGFGKKEIRINEGNIKLVSNSILVEGVKVEGPGTEFELDGKFANILPFLFADSLNSGKAELRFQADLNARKMDLDQMMALTETPEKKGSRLRILQKRKAIAKTRKRKQFTSLLKGTFKARIAEFNYNKVEGENFRGNVAFDNNELLVKGNLDAMDGAFKLDGKIFFEDKPYMKAEVEMAGIDVKEFFRQCENFGQEVVQSKHLKGDLQSQLLVNAYWKNDGTFLYDKLNVLGAINITQGELIDFAMLYDFADYVKIQDLKHIKFENMQNWLEVSKGQVHIPVMFLQSNAMNLTLSGDHTFDNKINYNLKINAGQVLVNKFKKYNKDMDSHKADRNGWFNLYYRIFGNTTKYKVVQDKRTVKRHFANSEHHKREIRVTLLREFGNTTKDIKEPIAWGDENENRTASDKEAEGYLDLETDPPPVLTSPTPTTPKEEEPEEPEEEDVYLDWEEEGGGGR